MVLKYLLPFDRIVIDSPYRIDEVRGRLRRETVKREWLRFGAAVGGTFEGVVRNDTFTVLTSAEGFQFFGWEGHRNYLRPVCNGHIMPSPGGCRIEVHMRPVILVLITPLIWLGMFGWWFVPASLGMTAASLEEMQGFIVLPAVFLAISYLFVLGFFWQMRDRAVRALNRIFLGD